MNRASSRTPLARSELIVLVLAFALALTPILQHMPLPHTPAWSGANSTPVATPDEHPSAPPTGINDGEWQSVQTQIREAEYHFTRHEMGDGFVAPNRTHDWESAFTQQGALVTAAAATAEDEAA